MEIVGAKCFGRLVGDKVGMAYLRNNLAPTIRPPNLNVKSPFSILKSQFSILDSFRDICVHKYDFFKFVWACKLFLGPNFFFDWQTFSLVGR